MLTFFYIDLQNKGNIEYIDSFVESSIEQLSSPIRSEMMTFAEEMEERGIQKAKLKRLLKGMLEGKARGIRREGIEQAKQDAAQRMLNEGVELAFISKVTDLSLADLERLQEKN